MEREGSHVGGQIGFSDQAPAKTLDAKARVTFPGWQYLMHVVSHHCWEKLMFMTPRKDDSWKHHFWTFLGSAYALLPWLTSICIFFS